MSDDTTPTPEMEAVLERYLAVQEEEKRLAEEKRELADKLKAFMRVQDEKRWAPTVGGQSLRISYRTTTEVEYDEDVLRERLGERYEKILSPNLKKMKRAMPHLRQVLQPVLREIGSPDAELVKQAVESGSVRADEFDGAYEKHRREFVTVSRAKPKQTQASHITRSP